MTWVWFLHRERSRLAHSPFPIAIFRFYFNCERKSRAPEQSIPGLAINCREISNLGTFSERKIPH